MITTNEIKEFIKTNKKFSKKFSKKILIKDKRHWLSKIIFNEKELKKINPKQYFPFYKQSYNRNLIKGMLIYKTFYNLEELFKFKYFFNKKNVKKIKKYKNKQIRQKNKKFITNYLKEYSIDLKQGQKFYIEDNIYEFELEYDNRFNETNYDKHLPFKIKKNIIYDLY